MKSLVVILLVILATAGFSLLLRAQSANQESSKALPDVYNGLRTQMLQSSRSKLNLPQASTPKTPWGVVMDWGVTKGTATVVALSDGHASIYLSSGGGYMGGGQSHDAIRKAAQKFVATAADVQTLTHLTTVYPLPQRGDVTFYFLTDVGVFVASASEKELSSHQHPLSSLSDAAQTIIAEYARIK